MVEKIVEYDFLKYSFFQNTIANYVDAFIAFIFFLIVFKILQVIIIHKLKELAARTETDIDDTLIAIIQTFKPPFYLFVAFYFALKLLIINDFVFRIVELILITWIVYQGIIALQILINYLLQKVLRGKDDSDTKAAIGSIDTIVKIGLWSIGGLLILSNFGVNITSLVAGLGIGGIAIAFALQSILGDLFSSFAILFDKPFLVGDFIVAGEYSGTVKKIGIKTTRLRALQGEEIIISNKELTSSKVQNFKRMAERRIVFALGVTYETPTDKLKSIPEMIKKIVTSTEKTDFSRAHFKSFDNSALMFEVVYNVMAREYDVYMDIQQEINFKIRECFEREGISMAYPTQTVYMHSMKS